MLLVVGCPHVPAIGACKCQFSAPLGIVWSGPQECMGFSYPADFFIAWLRAIFNMYCWSYRLCNRHAKVISDWADIYSVYKMQSPLTQEICLQISIWMLNVCNTFIVSAKHSYMNCPIYKNGTHLQIQIMKCSYVSGLRLDIVEFDAGCDWQTVASLLNVEWLLCASVLGHGREGGADVLLPIPIGGVFPGVGLDHQWLPSQALFTPGHRKPDEIITLNGNKHKHTYTVHKHNET